MAVTSALLKVLVVAVTGYAVTVTGSDEPISSKSNFALTYLQSTLDGLDRALQFLIRSYKEINVDALLGTRFVEATLSVLLRRLDHFNFISKLPPSILSQIKHVHRLSGVVCDRSTFYVMTSEPDYYANSEPILTRGFFELDYDSRNINQTSPIWPHKCQEAYSEIELNKCMTELFDTKIGIVCHISDACWEKMTSLGYSQYSLSHQLLYLQIAEQFGCQMEITWQIQENRQRSLESLHDTFCANMFSEARSISDEGFPQRYQDLFMEHVALCGMLGYHDFFNPDWLQHILSWQDIQDGCYKGDNRTSMRKATDCTMHRLQGRKKREETAVARDCLCHRTAVAITALAQYIRYILDSWFDYSIPFSPFLK